MKPMKLKPLAQAAALAIAEATPARVAISRSPLNCDLAPSDFAVVPRGATIESLIPEDLRGSPIVCSINGQFIARSEWSSQVRAGEIVVFQALPQGGQGGSNPLRLILTLAVMYVAFMVVGPWATTFFGSAGAGNLATAAFMMLGSLAINALVPLPPVNEQKSASPTYSVSFQGNSARVNQPIPVGYGQCFQLPDFASQPYVEYVDNDQYYYALLCIGKGKYDIMKLQIDDTDIQSFEDVSFQLVGPGQEIDDMAEQTLVDTAVVTSTEVAGQDLTDEAFVGPFTVCRAGTKVNKVSVDVAWPRGLANANSDGDLTNRTGTFEVQWRKIDDVDTPLSEWTSFGNHDVVRNTATPQTVTVSYEVEPARYQIQLRRVGEYSDSNNVLNDMMWAGMRGRLTESGIKDPASTFIALKVRASKQLSGQSQRKIGVMWRRHIPVWNGTAWEEKFTRNPAWAIADIWRNKEYGRGLPDSRIDLETLSSLAALWEARQDHFDYVFDSGTTVLEAAQLAARAGRAVPLVRRGRYTLVRDSEQEMPVAMFTPRNTRKGSLQVEYTMPTEDMPDAVRVTYRDGKVWADRSVVAQVHAGNIIVFRDGTLLTEGQPLPGTTAWDQNDAVKPILQYGYTDPTVVQDINLPGIVGEKQAMREAAYILAAGHFRRESVSLSTDTEGLLPCYGSLIAVSHDVPAWGQSAEVVSYDPATRVLVASVPLTWSSAAGAKHYVRLTGARGDVTSAIEVTRSVDDAAAMQLAVAPGVEIVDRMDGEREASRLAFGDSVEVCQFVRVRGIRPRSGSQVDLNGVVEDIRVHEADALWLPKGGVVQDPLDDGKLVPLTNVTAAKSAPADMPELIEIKLTRSRNGDFDHRGLGISYKNDGSITLLTHTEENGVLAWKPWPIDTATAIGDILTSTTGVPAMWASRALTPLEASGYESRFELIDAAINGPASATSGISVGFDYGAFAAEGIVGQETNGWGGLGSGRYAGFKWAIDGEVTNLSAELTVRASVRLRRNPAIVKTAVIRLTSVVPPAPQSGEG